MASIIKVDQLSEKTQGSGITLSHSLKNSSGSEIINSSGSIGSAVDFANIANDSISGDKIHGGTISGSELDSSVSFPSFVGMIASFAMSSAPTGWIVCNGAEYAIADYGDLHTAIGTTWGALTNGSGGAGSTHFRVPDLRGEFLRGFDNGQGNDPDAGSRTGGDAVGSSQGDALKSHNHTYTILDGQTLGAGTPNYRWSSASASWAYSGNFQTQNYGIDAAGTSSENRPRNKYVQYCIKY
jgi:microcystin-dependent protein